MLATLVMFPSVSGFGCQGVLGSKVKREASRPAMWWEGEHKSLHPCAKSKRLASAEECSTQKAARSCTGCELLHGPGLSTGSGTVSRMGFLLGLHLKKPPLDDLF